jgi:hypothetical protein
MNVQSSTFRKSEIKPAERLTSHDILCIANRLRGTDANRLRAFSYYMMNDVKRIHGLEAVLKAYIAAHDTDEMTAERCECDLCNEARAMLEEGVK